MNGRLDLPGTLSPIRIGTLAECLRYAHGVSAFCPRCRRWADLDLKRLVERGYGDRKLAQCRPRCRVCRTSGHIQLQAPAPQWRGPASHGNAKPVSGVTVD